MLLRAVNVRISPVRPCKMRSSQAGWQVLAIEILPDDLNTIRTKNLRSGQDADDCDLVVTAGGSGVGPRDVTPEATRAVIEKRDSWYGRVDAG